MNTRLVKNHLVVAPENPDQFAALFPEVKQAKVDGAIYCAVPHTLDHARVLANMGYQVVSPIRTGYGWPGRYNPSWWQIETSEAMTLHKRFFCLNAMRTRKTLSSLWAADYLRQQGEIKRTLITAPLSTLERVWGDHVFENFPRRTFAVLHGSRQKRLDLLAKEHDFYIVNHHGLGIIQEALQEREDINHIIVDELGVFRNSRTNLWKSLNAILNKSGFFRSAWGLTGTPTPQAPTDAYAQMKLIRPESYQGSFTKFRDLTMQQISQFRWVPRKQTSVYVNRRACENAEEIVAAVLQPSIRFTRSVVTDMQPQHIERKAELSTEQKKHYDQLLKLATTEVQGSTVTAVNAAVLLSKLTQAACGILYGPKGEVIKLDFGPRMSVLEELIEQNEEKVLVFVPFTGALDAVAEKLSKRWSTAVVDGGVSSGKRNKIFYDFQNAPDPHVMVAHPQTMAHGLELTRASLIVWYAPFPSNEIYQQACARIDGGGQKAKIDIATIYATTEERRAYAVLKDKGRMQDAILHLTEKK